VSGDFYEAGCPSLGAAWQFDESNVRDVVFMLHNVVEKYKERIKWRQKPGILNGRFIYVYVD
jgi:hypothetical protein